MNQKSSRIIRFFKKNVVAVPFIALLGILFALLGILFADKPTIVRHFPSSDIQTIESLKTLEVEFSVENRIDILNKWWNREVYISINGQKYYPDFADSTYKFNFREIALNTFNTENENRKFRFVIFVKTVPGSRVKEPVNIQLIKDIPASYSNSSNSQPSYVNPLTPPVFTGRGHLPNYQDVDGNQFYVEKNGDLLIITLLKENTLFRNGINYIEFSNINCEEANLTSLDSIYITKNQFKWVNGPGRTEIMKEITTKLVGEIDES